MGLSIADKLFPLYLAEAKQIHSNSNQDDLNNENQYMDVLFFMVR